MSEEEKRESTPTFTATIRLKTPPKQVKHLLMLSDCARQLYNACLGEGIKRLHRLQHTTLYRETVQLPKTKRFKHSVLLNLNF
ncbi:hypothetical protein [Neobacillus massiliamazoniensis]|uniref:Uncharacterized protein n=1 Tax=Neobacillus massiliamazoniensis TaxID=1499688 RepID=A0A0U1NR23_9BACI|nr:hypothetical protein [Neobacillus massiliamazoniensis]CRK80198.1 hypothetical protein BN000_00079 [Neobacillus massiliamazoniensis]